MKRIVNNTLPKQSQQMPTTAKKQYWGKINLAMITPASTNLAPTNK